MVKDLDDGIESELGPHVEVALTPLHCEHLLSSVPHAGLGDDLTTAAAAMGICRNTARKIAREHNIKFTDGRKAQ